MSLLISPVIIEALASAKGADRVAVENFLCFIGDDRHVAYENLRADSRSYGWNSATIEAICKGISQARRPEAGCQHRVTTNTVDGPLCRDCGEALP